MGSPEKFDQSMRIVDLEKNKTIDSLKEKIKEYGDRTMNNKISPESKVDASYKIWIAQEFIKNGGPLDNEQKEKLYNIVKQTEGFMEDDHKRYFNDAYGVIENYWETGGKGVVGGTGFGDKQEEAE